MEFELSTEQDALQAAARQMLDARCDRDHVRAHIAERTAAGDAFDGALFAAMLDQGWGGIATPASDGGVGLGWVEAVLLITEVGRHAAPVPLAPTLLGLAALGSASEHGDLRHRLLVGESRAAVAWTASPEALVVSEPAGEGADERVDERVDERAGGTVTLTGRLGLVEGASQAEVVVVVSPSGVWLVETPALATRPTAEPAMDLTRSLSWLTLTGTPAICLGGRAAARAIGARGALASSAELLGGAERILEMTTQYAKDRVQFGAPIGSFQAVKHRCADMLVDVEGMRSLTWYAAWAAATEEEGWQMAASAAKVWCAQASRRVMSSGLQVHGGIGFTWEHDLHLFLKRAQFSQLDYGDAAYHRDLLASYLLASAMAGRSVL